MNNLRSIWTFYNLSFYVFSLSWLLVVTTKQLITVATIQKNTMIIMTIGWLSLIRPSRRCVTSRWYKRVSWMSKPSSPITPSLGLQTPVPSLLTRCYRCHWQVSIMSSVSLTPGIWLAVSNCDPCLMFDHEMLKNEITVTLFDIIIIYCF